MTPEERAARAIRARHTQDDDVLAEAFEGAAVDIIQAWENARWSRTRERLHAELKALQRVRAKIAQYANAVPR